MNAARTISEILLDSFLEVSGRDPDAPLSREDALELLAQAFEQGRQSVLAEAVNERHAKGGKLS